MSIYFLKLEFLITYDAYLREMGDENKYDLFRITVMSASVKKKVQVKLGP